MGEPLSNRSGTWYYTTFMNTPDLPNWILQAYKILQGSGYGNKFTIKDAERILAGTEVATIRIILSRLNKSGLLISEPSPTDSRLRIYSLLPLENASVRNDPPAIPPLRSLAPHPASHIHAEKKVSTVMENLVSPAPEPAYREINPGDISSESGYSPPGTRYPFLSFLADIIKGPEDITIISIIIWLRKIRDCTGPGDPIPLQALITPHSEEFRELSDQVSSYVKTFSDELLSGFSLSSFSVCFSDWLARRGQLGRQYIEPAITSFLSVPFSSSGDREGTPAISPRDLISLFSRVPGKFLRTYLVVDPLLTDLMVCLGNPTPGEQIYNPCSGYGEFLAAIDAYLGHHPDTTLAAECYVSSFAKKAGPKPYISAILCDIFNIQNLEMQAGDLLRHPAYWDGIGSGRFDLVIGKIPSGIKGYTDELLKEDNSWPRYRYGFPSRRNADWLFIQHIAASLNATGRAVIIVPAETLIRKGADNDVRSMFLRKGPVEGVILLPGEGGLLVDAQVLLILNNNKPESRKDLIFCIDATKRATPADPTLTSGYQYGWIPHLYHTWQEEPGISRVVPIREILDNGGAIAVPYLIHGRSSEPRALPDWRWESLTRQNHRIFAGTDLPTSPDGSSPVLTPDDIDMSGFFSIPGLRKTRTIPPSEFFIPPRSVVFTLKEYSQPGKKPSDTVTEWCIDKVSLTTGRISNLLGGKGVCWIELTDPSILPEYLGLILHLIQHRVRFSGTLEMIQNNGLQIRIPVPPDHVQVQIVKTVWKDTYLRTFLEQMIVIRENQ